MTEREWRVVMEYPGLHAPFVTTFASEADCQEYVELERIDYPHATITVESRDVGPWEPTSTIVCHRRRSE